MSSLNSLFLVILAEPAPSPRVSSVEGCKLKNCMFFGTKILQRATSGCLGILVEKHSFVQSPRKKLRTLGGKNMQKNATMQFFKELTFKKMQFV